MNRKVIIGYDSFNRWIHRRYIKMSQCFPKPYKSFETLMSKWIYLIMQQKLN